MNNDQLQQLLNGIQNALNQRNEGAKLMSFTNKEEEMTWQNFRSHFVTVMETCEWNNLHSRRQLKIAMKGKAATLVSDLNVNDFANIQAMLNAFEARFVPAAEGTLIRAEFRAAKQKPGETLLQFHTRLRTLFVPAYPNEPVGNNRHLIDTYIAGIADPAVKMYTLDRTPNTFMESLTNSQTKEANMLTYRASQNETNVQALEEGVNALRFGGAGAIGGRCCFACSGPHLMADCPVMQKFKEFTGSQGNPTSSNRRGGNRGRGGRGRGGRGWRGNGRGGGGSRGRGGTMVNNLQADGANQDSTEGISEEEAVLEVLNLDAYPAGN